MKKLNEHLDDKLKRIEHQETKLKRRKFLQGAATLGAALALEHTSGLTHSSHAADSRIEVLLGEEVGTISPNIYGHFAEHLGGVVYDGIWVARIPKCRIPVAFVPRWLTL